MKLLSWNCQGLGNPLTVRVLRATLARHLPQIAFLMETKSDRLRLDSIKFPPYLPNKFIVDCVGLSGGLCLLWSGNIHITVLHSSPSLIECEVQDGLALNKWRLLCVYGPPRQSDRPEFWASMQLRTTRLLDPFLLVGDFNQILCAGDKDGGLPVQDSQLAVFRDFVQGTGLIELISTGCHYSWSNRRRAGSLIREKLDRAFCSVPWKARFPDSGTTLEPAIGSDHSPLIVTCFPPRPQGKPVFRFEDRWRDLNGCFTTIKNGWSIPVEGSGLENFSCKIANVCKLLKKWKKSIPHVDIAIRTKMKDLQELKNQQSSPMLAIQLDRIQTELAEALHQQERLWHQRSRQLWIQCGDQNTKFFHNSTLQRRSRNRIPRLRTSNGQWLDDESSVDTELQTYFQQLYQAEVVTHLDEVLAVLPQKFSSDMNTRLCIPITVEEVKTALFSMKPLKSPGPDGFPPAFYQHYWAEVGNDLFSAVTNFFASETMLPELNHTHLVLIPKRDSPERADQFRPLSLTNVAYRVCAKVLSTRLNTILPDIISQEQNAFVAGRTISKNVLITHEIHHAMKHNRKGKKYMGSFKLDLGKAFDSIEWPFQESVLEKLGLCTKWIRLLMSCVQSVSYSLLVNEVEKQIFTPTRGLRLGDSLSPALFFLCTECLTALIRRAVEERYLAGIKVHSTSPEVTHSFFADDCIIFLQETHSSVGKLNEILQLYCQASSQAINLCKSTASFSPNTPPRLQLIFARIVGIQEVKFPGKYLGLPSDIGKAKKSAFQEIKDRTLNKLSSWESLLLSSAGREVLIKVVATATPTYAMQHFKLPDGMLDELNSAICNFWWGQKS